MKTTSKIRKNYKVSLHGDAPSYYAAYSAREAAEMHWGNRYTASPKSIKREFDVTRERD